MLDNQMPDSEDTLEAQDETIIDAPEAEAEEPELTVTIEGEEPEVDEDADIEADLGERGKKALKARSDALKEAKAKLRTAEAKLAEREAAPAKQEPELVKPTLADCDFNDDIYAAKTEEYVIAKLAAKTKADAALAAEKQKIADYDVRKDKYFAERAKMGVDDDLQEIVTSKMADYQMTIIIDASPEPAKIIAALAKSPKALAELSAIKDVHKFSYRLAQIEGKITVTQKTPPPAETKLRGGGTTTSGGGSLSAQLTRAEADFERSGDRTEIQRIKRLMREAGVAA